MSTPAPGRNDRCPCGSGRKYKHCCLRAAEATTSLWHQLRQAEGRLIPLLTTFALEAWGDDGFDEAQRRFYDGVTLPDDPGADREFDSLFITWFALHFSPAREPDQPAALHCLREDGDLSDLERRFLVEASAEPVSFHLITGVDPGHSIDVEDLLTGTTRTLLERSASQTVQRGGVVFGRAITVGGISIMTGMGVTLLPPAWRIDIMRLRQRFEDATGPLTRERVLLLDDVLRRYYLTIADQIFNPAPPQLRNTDGDPFVQATLHFDLRCSPDEALIALRSLSQHVDDEDAIHNRTADEAGSLRAFSLDWTKRGNRLHKSWDNTILGHIDVDGATLTATVNSNRRATRLRKQIERRLGEFAALQRIVTEPMEALLAKSSASRDSDVRPLPSVIDPELTAQFLDQHWDDWLDSPVPALGHLTPRQAVKTPAGRAQVEALLDDFAWHAGRGQDVPVERLRAALLAGRR